MVNTIRRFDPAYVSSIPTVQDWPKRREHWRVAHCEGEPNTAILVARSEPAVADKPPQDETEFARPLGGKIEHCCLPVFSDVDVGGLERELLIFRKASFPGLNQEFVHPRHQVLDGNPTGCRQDLVIRSRSKFES